MDRGKFGRGHGNPADGGESRFPQPADAGGSGAERERDEFLEAFLVFWMQRAFFFLVFDHLAEVVVEDAAVAEEDDGGGSLLDLLLVHAGDTESLFHGGIVDYDKVRR